MVSKLPELGSALLDMVNALANVVRNEAVLVSWLATLVSLGGEAG